MKVKQLLIVILTFTLLVVGLTACGGKTDDSATSGGSGDTKKTEATPTNTPTPTEVPKTPEQLDQDALDLIFASAKVTATDGEYELEEGAKFCLEFDGDHITLELETKNNSFKRKIWEKWLNGAKVARAEYPLQSEQYQADCKYGNITGVLGSEGNIKWTASNLSEDLFAELSKKGVEVAPSYVQRQKLFDEIKGDWAGDVSLSLKYLVDTMVDKNDKETISFYNNLISFLKNYGFNGNIPITLGVSFLSAKELRFHLTVDWSGFLNSIDKATANEDGMLKFLCVCTGADKSAIKAYVKSEGTTVMIFGRAVVKLLKKICDDYPGENALCKYELSGNTLLIRGASSYDELIYDKDKGTMTYRDMGIECVLKRK
ncbi:MAG: hypothetical protein IK055_09930 [Lachnospiraceae bacterium]|nr:hypothetical protein [Lachnospiraceae bacterium]